MDSRPGRAPLRRRIGGLVFWLGLTMGCVSFRLTVPDLPETTVDYAVFTAALPAGSDLATPPPPPPGGVRPAALYSVVRIAGLSRPATLRWYWYSPQQKLARESPALPVNGKGKNLEYVVAWDRLPEEAWGQSPGRWSVEIRLDDRPLATGEVELTAGTAPPAPVATPPADDPARRE